MKISVLIPCFNRELFIKESIESIQNQTYKDLEIICYDDGSSDKTVEIIKEMQKQDNRIKLIEGLINHGEAFSRNRLLDACRTEIACWQDSDDISLPKRIELQVKEIELGNNLVFTAWNWYGYNGEKWIKKDRASNHLGSPTVMFRVNKDFKFNEDYKLSGTDWEFLNRIRVYYGKVVEISEVLYLLRNHNDRMGIMKLKIREKFSENEIKAMSYENLLKGVK